MKKISVFVFCFIPCLLNFTFFLALNLTMCTFYSFSQGIAINTTGAAANDKAMLDVSGTSLGVLINRMTTTERDAISTPVPESLLIYNTTTKCFETYINGVWQTISCGCTSAPSAITASASSTTLCAGSTLMLIGGATGATNWSWTGPNGFTSTSQSPAITNITTTGTGVYTLTASNACGSATAVSTASITVNSIGAASISIAAVPTGAICAGTSVTYTATPTNGGTTPSYQWIKGATNITGEINPTYTTTTLANSDIITCVMTSNNTCATGSPATSSGITMTVNALPTPSFTAQPGASACIGVDVTYTTQESMTNYAWVVPGTLNADYSITSGGVGTTSNTVTLKYLTAGSKTVTINYTNSNGCTAASATSSTATTASECFTCGTSKLTDSRDSKQYNTVLIDTQCWMAENLNIGTRIDGGTEQTANSTIEKYCQGNSESNCSTYGGLYEWAEMVQYYNNANNIQTWDTPPPGTLQGICPIGWHIPTVAEWTTLTNYLTNSGNYGCGGNTTKIGKSMASKTGWWYYMEDACTIGKNPENNNSSGLGLPPGGSRHPSGSFQNLTQVGRFWSRDEKSGAYTYATMYSMNNDQPNIGPDDNLKTNGYSVRCIKN
ncbi:MAG: hypothetical protein HGB12_04835 [Bacteroidetes bacterium]|nr:hypothetical protein [Bacteroidota bacterium]